MARPIGIDLGTTFSAVATINESGVAEIVRNGDGQTITPSVVLFDNGEAIVGQQAKLQRAAFPDDVVEFVKRQMGNQFWRFYPTVGDPYTPEGISAIILKRIVSDASQVLGETVQQVVITVPAYFDDAQRKATKDAGEIAGLDVLSVINEPTAAAVSFGVEHDYNGTVLVYDLGGGTFDVTLLKAHDGTFDIIRTDGDRILGGFDFDNVIIEWIKSEFAAQTGATIEGESEAQLRDRAEQAKHRLSVADQAPIFVSAAGNNQKLILTREKFEEITESLLARTQMLLEDVVEAAGYTFRDIDKVLVVGGSTRMPMVTRMLTSVTGQAPDSRFTLTRRSPRAPQSWRRCDLRSGAVALQPSRVRTRSRSRMSCRTDSAWSRSTATPAWRSTRSSSKPTGRFPASEPNISTRLSTTRPS